MEFSREDTSGNLSGQITRQYQLERRLQLFTFTGQSAIALQGWIREPELVVVDWLEGLSLRLRIPWLAILVNTDGKWRVLHDFQRQDMSDRQPCLEDLLPPIGIPEKPEEQRSAGAERVWRVPYREGGLLRAQLVCGGFDTNHSERWLNETDWQQLFAQIAAPLLRFEANQRDMAAEGRYETLEKLLSGGWWEYHPESQSMTFAPRLMELLGIVDPVARLSRDAWFKLFDSLEREEFLTRLSQCAGDGKYLSCSLRLRVEQQVHWYRFEGRAVMRRGERHILGFALNIDGIRRQEEEAEATKARLSGLMDSVPGVIYVQRYERGSLQLVFYSAGPEQDLGWTREDLLAAPYTTFLHPGDRLDYLEQQKQLLRQGRASCQYRMRNKAGDYCWIQDEARLVRDEKGMPSEVIGLRLNVTETKTAVERVYLSEESYRTLVEDSPVIICRYLPDLRVTFANPMLAACLGIESEQMAGLNLGDYLPPDQREKALLRLSALEPEHPFVSSEICIRRSDYDRRWWVMFECGVFDEQGRLLEVQAVGRDNTEVHLMRYQLFQSAKMATLGEMAAGLAHEINQPLNVIHMTLTNLLPRIANGNIEPDYLLAKVERIASQVRRTEKLVDHMRVFGRQSDIEGVAFKLTVPVEGALSLLEQKLSEEAVSVEVSLTDLPEVVGHPDRLEQVLINLIINALYAVCERRESEPKLQPLICIDGRVVNNMVRLSVRDNGGGIRPELLDRVFEPFFTTKPVGQGTGLGLSVSYAIVKQMSGRLFAENDLDGAIFSIELPPVNGKTSAQCRQYEMSMSVAEPTYSKDPS